MRRVGVLVLLAGVMWTSPAAAQDAAILGDGRLLGVDGHAVVWLPAGTDDLAVHWVDTRRTEAMPAMSGCTPTAVGAGQILFSCPVPFRWGAQEVPVLRDLRTGVVSNPSVVPEAYPLGAERMTWDGVGRRWLSFEASGYRSRLHRFVSRTSAQAFRSSPYAADRLPDLDRVGLVRRVCGPGTAFGDETGPGLGISDGWGGVVVSGRWAVASMRERPVLLWRCGDRRTRVLCARSCGSATLHRHRVLWTRGSRVWIRRLSSRRTGQVRVPGARVTAARGVADRVAIQLSQHGTSRVAVAPLP